MSCLLLGNTTESFLPMEERNEVETCPSVSRLYMVFLQDGNSIVKCCPLLCWRISLEVCSQTWPGECALFSYLPFPTFMGAT